MKPVTRQLALLLSGLAILAGINATVWRYEHAMSSGEVVLLRLAPVDPRSLMQGDYMRLNYEIARELTSRDAQTTQNKGSDTLVIRLDAHQVATLVADGKPDRLASDERLLQVHQSERQWQIGPDA
ncbi:GDYXXLXY domain-containing protein, partial [Aeromonas hydrophila]